MAKLELTDEQMKAFEKAIAAAMCEDIPEIPVGKHWDNILLDTTEFIDNEIDGGVTSFVLFKERGEKGSGE